MIIGSVFITAAGIYLLYRGYNIGVKKELSTKDNPNMPEDMRDPEGYCKFLSRIFNFLGVLAFICGVISFLDDVGFLKLGYYIWIFFGILFVAVVVCSIILSKYLKKFY